MKIVHNYERDGIELYFDEKPTNEILTMLRRGFWLWHRTKKCWYNNDNEYNAQLADVILCYYLKQYIIKNGFDYDNLTCRETLSSMEQTILRIKRRRIPVNNLPEYESYVHSLLVRKKQIEVERKAQEETDRKRNDELIARSHLAFFNRAWQDYSTNGSSFWELYDRYICFDKQVQEYDFEEHQYINKPEFRFVLSNPDRQIQSIVNNSPSLKYDRVIIQINFEEKRELGWIIFGSEKYEIPETISKKIISEHLPSEHKKAMEKMRREIVFERARVAEARLNAAYNRNYNGPRCLYCGAPVQIGIICEQCKKLYIRK